MKTLIISSSLSEYSRSYILCKAVLDYQKALGIDVHLLDLRQFSLLPTHVPQTEDCLHIKDKIAQADNIVFGMGVHCYSINDNLKIFLDTCMGTIKQHSLFGILCAAGGQRSYLATMHLTQICMNERRMIQLPRVVFATEKDFDGQKISNEDVVERCEMFAKEFVELGKKLL